MPRGSLLVFGDREIGIVLNRLSATEALCNLAVVLPKTLLPIVVTGLSLMAFVRVSHGDFSLAANVVDMFEELGREQALALRGIEVEEKVVIDVGRCLYIKEKVLYSEHMIHV